MKTYLSEIIPKIKRYSEKLDNIALLTGQHWVMLDDIDNNKKVFIFRNSNELLISVNGRVTKGKWELLGGNTILIDFNNNSFLYKHGFFDENVLAIKIDGVNEYSFLINETKFEGELNTLENITLFLKDKYITSENPKLFSRKDEYEGHHFQKNKTKYQITREEKGWSFSTGKYIEYRIDFDNKIGTVLFDSKMGQYCYSSFDKVHYFKDLNECILAYIDYIENKE